MLLGKWQRNVRVFLTLKANRLRLSHSKSFLQYADRTWNQRFAFLRVFFTVGMHSSTKCTELTSSMRNAVKAKRNSTIRSLIVRTKIWNLITNKLHLSSYLTKLESINHRFPMLMGFGQRNQEKHLNEDHAFHISSCMLQILTQFCHLMNPL